MLDLFAVHQIVLRLLLQSRSFFPPRTRDSQAQDPGKTQVLSEVLEHTRTSKCMLLLFKGPGAHKDQQMYVVVERSWSTQGLASECFVQVLWSCLTVLFVQTSDYPTPSILTALFVQTSDDPTPSILTAYLYKQAITLPHLP